jgi:hypothetical protein
MNSSSSCSRFKFNFAIDSLADSETAQAQPEALAVCHTWPGNAAQARAQVWPERRSSYLKNLKNRMVYNLRLGPLGGIVSPRYVSSESTNGRGGDGTSA